MNLPAVGKLLRASMFAYHSAMNPPDTLRFTLHDRIDDTEVDPSHVPLALLGQFRNDIEDFLKGSGREVDPNKVFVSVEKGSLTFAVAGLVAATGLWNDIAQLQRSSSLGLMDPKRAAVMERWQEAARKSPHRSYVLADADHLTIRVSSDSDFRNRTESVWVAVEKYLQGMVVDLGGATNPNIHLRTASGVLIITASQKLLAEDEKNRLYRPALLRVAAEENLGTGELRNMSLLAFEDLQPVFDEEAFQRLLEKGAKAWADVPDAASWVEELRGNV